MLFKSLQKCEKMVIAGQTDIKILIKELKKTLEQIPNSKIDYINIVSTETLEDLQHVKGRVLVALAVKIGSTRLIDNLIIDVSN